MEYFRLPTGWPRDCALAGSIPVTERVVVGSDQQMPEEKDHRPSAAPPINTMSCLVFNAAIAFFPWFAS